MAKDLWRMPKVNMGDTVLFSTDIHGFGNPVIGFVTQAGESTLRILTFTPTGWVDRISVHHKDDPDLGGDNGWAELGCWAISSQTEAIYKAAALASATSPNPVKERMSVGSK
jgi:hypothetical protein